MKKVILVMMVVMLFLVASMTTVNAASVSADKTSYKEGDTVTVTLTLDAPTRNVDVTLKYDADAFTYTDGSAKADGFAVTANGKNAGVIYVSGSDASATTSKVTFTFTAKKASESNVSFTASDLVTEGSETLTTPTAEVKVEEKAAEEDNKTEDNTKTEDKTKTEDNTKTDNSGTTNTNTGTTTNTTGSITTDSGAYTILEGKNQTYDLDLKKALLVRASGDVSKFVEVRIDGKVLDKSNYSIKSGSTIVEVKPEYLSNLPQGEHELRVVYTDGSVSTNFQVAKSSTNAGSTTSASSTTTSSAKPTKLPQTGVPYIAIAFVAVVALAVVIVKVKNK